MRVSSYEFPHVSFLIRVSSYEFPHVSFLMLGSWYEFPHAGFSMQALCRQLFEFFKRHGFCKIVPLEDVAAHVFEHVQLVFQLDSFCD